MPILSVRVVKNPRISRRCDNCYKRISGETIRLYGMADYGDKPYNVFLHRECVTGRDTLAKLRVVEHRDEAVGEGAEESPKTLRTED